MQQVQNQPAMNIRVPQPVADWLRAKAEQDRRSLRFTVAEVLSQAMQVEKAKEAA